MSSTLAGSTLVSRQEQAGAAVCLSGSGAASPGIQDGSAAGDGPAARDVATPDGAIAAANGSNRPASALGKTDIGIFIAIYGAAVALAVALCLTARVTHAEAWQWGLRLMNAPLAVAGAGLLVLSSAAAAAAAWWARRRTRGTLTLAALGVAVLAALGFVATLAVDVETKWAYGVRPGEQFRPSERYLAHRFRAKLPPKEPVVAAPIALTPARSIDAVHGRKLFLGTCMSCHGVHGEGLPGQGKSLIANEFVGGLSDAKLLDFVKGGRPPWDPLNTTKVQMPPRGGNPMLTDDDLRDVIAYLRTLQPKPDAAAVKSGDAASSSPAVAAAPAEDVDPLLLLPRWVVPPLPAGPSGLSPTHLAGLSRPAWTPPTSAVAFANTYYLAAQFGAVHAAGVAAALITLLIRARRRGTGRVGGTAFGLTCGASLGLTAAWLIVFPFVYLV